MLVICGILRDHIYFEPPIFLDTGAIVAHEMLVSVWSLTSGNYLKFASVVSRLGL